MIVNQLNDYYSNNQPIVTNHLNHIISDDLDFIDDPNILELINHPYVLNEYLKSLYNKVRFNLSDELKNKIFETFKIVRENKVEELARIRTFKPIGTYCGTRFKQPDGYYFFLNDEPILVTRFLKDQLDEQMIGLPLRQEVRILASLAFSMQFSSFSFNLLYNIYDVPSDLVLENEDISDIKTQAIIRILSRIRDNYGDLIELPGKSVRSKFKFNTKYFSLERARLFYSSFNIQDDLLLRSSLLILKSKMLWEDEGRLYAEDACSNLFIAIEGILRLIHCRIFNGKKFEIKPTLEHISQKFHGGEYWIGVLQDIYDKRIQIVHPAESFWMPELSDDDYYDNYGIALDLIFYAVTGDLLSRDY